MDSFQQKIAKHENDTLAQIHLRIAKEPLFKDVGTWSADRVLPKRPFFRDPEDTPTTLSEICDEMIRMCDEALRFDPLKSILREFQRKEQLESLYRDSLDMPSWVFR